MPWTIHKPVVVPFDFSEHSIQALKRAVRLVEAPRQIHVLHVLPLMTPTEPGVVWGTVDDEGRIKHALEAMAKALPQSEYGGLCHDVRLGDPGHIIAERAEELAAELIVIGSHGRTGIPRLVLGSVAERVTRMASCPVLVVKISVQAEPAAEKAFTARAATAT